eukprot:436155-Pelagomonas_calceolata.AAC.2
MAAHSEASWGHSAASKNRGWVEARCTAALNSPFTCMSAGGWRHAALRHSTAPSLACPQQICQPMDRLYRNTGWVEARCTAALNSALPCLLLQCMCVCSQCTKGNSAALKNRGFSRLKEAVNGLAYSEPLRFSFQYTV